MTGGTREKEMIRRKNNINAPVLSSILGVDGGAWRE